MSYKAQIKGSALSVFALLEPLGRLGFTGGHELGGRLGFTGGHEFGGRAVLLGLHCASSSDYEATDGRSEIYI